MNQRPEISLDRTLPSSDGRPPEAPPELALARTHTPRSPALDRTLTPPPDFDPSEVPAAESRDSELEPYDLRESPSASPRLAATRLGDDEPRLALPVPDADDRRERELIKAKLFRRKAAPVKIGRFTVLARLGEGGMGVVYTAYDDQLDRKVAVKVLRGEVTRQDQLGRTRLLREAQAMARLSHPNIVTVHEVGALSDEIFIAMEFVRGHSLDAWLRAQPRPWQEVLATFVKAGRGLEAAHRAGIIHRDFKPHNVLVGEEGVVKVLDFGLARASDHAGSEELAATPESGAYNEQGSLLGAPLTRTGAIMGTPAYMAPEQHEGRLATAQSDQFSFCVSLHEGLYGVHPFDCTTLGALLASTLAGRIRDPGSTKVPGWLRRVLIRGLAVEPERRYPSMTELLADLGRDPAVARRRWLTTAALTGFVGSASFGAAALLPAAAPVCQGIDAELVGVWDADRSEAVRAALLATGVPYAADTWARVQPRLDAHAQAWLAMRGEACETHHAARQSDQLFDLRTACLDQRRDGLRALVDVLAEADAAAVEKAVTAVDALPAISSCADTDALTSAVPPPDDPALRQQVGAARAALARAKAHEDAGQYAQAIALTTPLLADAAVTAYRPLEAEALLRRGDAAMNAGDGEAAHRDLELATRIAVAAKHDSVAALAASRDLFVRGELLQRPADALADAPMVAALVDRTGPDGQIHGEFLNNLGVVHMDAGDLAAAKTTLLAALAAKRALPASPMEIAYTLMNLGFLAVLSERVSEGISRYEEAIALTVTALGPGHPQTLAMQYNLAVAYRRQGKLRQAGALLRDISRRGGAALGASHELRIATALGELEVAAHDLEAAQATFTAALAAARSGDGRDPSACLALLGLADVAALSGDLATTRQRGAEADELCRKIYGDDNPQMASAEQRRGEALRIAGAAEEALALFERARDVYARTTGADTPLMAEVLESIGVAKARLGRPDEAAAELRRALAIREAALPPDSPAIARALRHLGELALGQGQPGDATPLLRRAVAIYSAASDADLPDLALARFALARALHATDRADEAAEQATQARTALRARGEHFRREADELDAWLKGQVGGR